MYQGFRTQQVREAVNGPELAAACEASAEDRAKARLRYVEREQLIADLTGSPAPQPVVAAQS